jgi:hypothetical protein
VAPFVPLSAGAQVELVHVLGGQVISNRLWFVFDNPPYLLADLQGLADGVADWWEEEILPSLSSDLVTAAVTATDWTTDPPLFDATHVLNIAGGVATESLSANVAIVVPFRWPIGVRLKRNKHYVPGVPEAEVTLNTPSAAIRDVLFEGYASLIDRARLFTPILNWRWVATSQWDARALRSVQTWFDVQGPPIDRAFVLGQRRKRLP